MEVYNIVKKVACIPVAIISNDVINKIQVHTLTRLSGVLD